MTNEDRQTVIDALELAHLSCRPDGTAFPHVVAALAIMRRDREESEKTADSAAQWEAIQKRNRAVIDLLGE